MMKFRKTYILPALFLLTLGMVAGVEIESFMGDSEVAQWKKLRQAFEIVGSKYVDPVDENRIVENAILGMLEDLDPHSTYISSSEIQELQEEYQGSFGGIGILFELPEDTVRVVSTIPDGPSEKVGIMAGDRIVSINDSTAVGLTDRQIQKKLKGPIGTPVSVTVLRPGVREPIEFDITRGRIPLYTIDSSYMLDETTGYIRINRFAMTTYSEFLDAIEKLREMGMERLMLDLRSNPGGVMDPAIEIADELLGGNKSIVYTKSRHSDLEAEYQSTDNGILEEQPVIVLVNPYSASASEIVAGALQDHDRALIVGQRTFGKGLVQQQFQLEDGGVIQLTVSRYYTPSGRLIQTPYEDGNQQEYYESKFATLEDATYHPGDYKESIPDSLKFKTDHGRIVFGGGGILPDYVVAPDTTSVSTLIAESGLDDLFIRDWFENRESQLRDRWGGASDQFISEFEIDEQMWTDFLSFVKSHEMDIPKSASDNGNTFSRDKIEQGRDELETRLKFHIARRLYGFQESLPIVNRIDPILNAAMKLWGRAEELASISHVTQSGK